MVQGNVIHPPPRLKWYGHLDRGCSALSRAAHLSGSHFVDIEMPVKRAARHGGPKDSFDKL